MLLSHRIVSGLTVVSVLAATAVNIAFAADRTIPVGYYSRIDGKREGDLKTTLHNIIYNHTEVSSYSDLPRYFQRTDMYPGTRQWWDMYGNIPLYGPSFAGLNREHSLPKSWWGGNTDIPAYVDLNHLYPSEATANQAKSNYPLGTVDRSVATRFDNGVSTVGFAVTGQGGGAAYVFEPDDEYKGDFARTYFYMATCYQNLTWKYTYMLSNNLYPTLNGWSQELLLKWHRQDPVSQKEIDRNEEIYSIQANRNPFIDFPELAEYIWGRHKGDAFILSEHEGGTSPGNSPTLITPVQGMELDFGDVALGHSSVSKLHLLGENLTGRSLALSIYDNAETQDAALFSMDDGNQRFNASVSAVNSADGLWVNITYTPTSLGTHTTRLVISGGGISGSLGIGLIGRCLPVPELSAPTAKEPTDITSDSYTANWTPVDGEIVDYFVVNRTRYEGGTASTEQLVSEDSSLEITEFSGYESYTVQSVRLGIYSPQSNVMFVGQNSITGIDGDKTFGLRRHPDGVMITGPDHLGRVSVYDTTGRLLFETEDSRNGDVLELKEGIYLIRSAACGTTLRTIISGI